MNTSFVLIVVTLSTLLLGQNASVSGQVPAGTDEIVRHLAEKTIDAIRNNDTAFLSNLIDPSGIVVGVDTPKISAKRFKKELGERRGIYCVIFGRNCPKITSKQSPAAFSLREGLNQRVSIHVGSVQDAPEIATAEVRRADNNETLFTLYFRHLEHHWTLQNIEYW